MLKLNLWATAVATLVGAITLFAPETSEAQWRVNGARRGVERWREGGRGWYTNPWYGWGYGNPGYYYSGDYYPRYEAGVYVTPDFSPAPQGYQSNYFDDATFDATSTSFVVRVPDPNAEIWFENRRTQQRGTLRQYTSGNLDPNHEYTFHIRARWIDNGQQVEQSRDVNARAGQQINVDFSVPIRERIPTNPD
jgi:uncharacterized protein (TIGR03000 family)